MRDGRQTEMKELRWNGLREYRSTTRVRMSVLHDQGKVTGAFFAAHNSRYPMFSQQHQLFFVYILLLCNHFVSSHSPTPTLFTHCLRRPAIRSPKPALQPQSPRSRSQHVFARQRGRSHGPPCRTMLPGETPSCSSLPHLSSSSAGHLFFPGARLSFCSCCVLWILEVVSVGYIKLEA